MVLFFQARQSKLIEVEGVPSRTLHPLEQWKTFFQGVTLEDRGLRFETIK